MEASLAVARDGLPTVIVGIPVSTITVALSCVPAAAKFPAQSDADLAAMDMPRVPLFLKPERVTSFFIGSGTNVHGPGLQPTPGSGVTLIAAEANFP